MKEYVLTQSYPTINDMIESGEVKVYIDELKYGDIDKYAIVSRIGNRYNINGEKIVDFVQNPFFAEEAKKENIKEVTDMKYSEIETLIDNEIAKAVEAAIIEKDNEIAEIKAAAKEQAKAELIAKLND